MKLFVIRLRIVGRCLGSIADRYLPRSSLRYKNSRMYLKTAAYAFSVTVLVAGFSAPLHADSDLGIDHGRYVQSRHECNAPKHSMLFIYDGTSIKSEKTTCTFSNVKTAGRVRTFDENCSYYHRSWSVLPTTVSKFKTTIQVVNKREFILKRENETLEFNDEYRWCAPE